LCIFSFRSGLWQIGHLNIWDKFYSFDQSFSLFAIDPNHRGSSDNIIRKGILYDCDERYTEISKKNVNHIFFEDENQAWIAATTGVFKAELKLNPFKNYFALAPGTYSVNTATSIRGMLVDQQQLWICDVSGLISSLGLTSGETTLAEFQLNSNRINRKRRKLSILHDDDDKLLLGGLDLGTYQSDKKEYRTFSSEYDSLSNGSIWSLFKDQKGQIWAGYLGGIGFLDSDKGTLVGFGDYNGFMEYVQSS
jgi:ligand-binding sensor domain-containing protein